MPKAVSSQWDFGELFPVEPVRRVLSVTELTGQVKRLLEKQIGLVWISGEITNLRVQSSGHLYFTLKDAGAQLNCVLFRGDAARFRALIEDGRKVLAQGDLTVYEPRGQYQLIVRAVEQAGLGALQAAFEKLKQKLDAEGLFAAARKRPLPAYPERIGVVTSPTGAAIRDVLHVVQRRNPALEMILAPARVQGEGAGAEIAAAIRWLNAWSQSLPPAEALDLILVTRGGGSLEDLWAFNEEVVARAIYESALPVVSAVGHEIDFTISDFVADLRAATPSAAAEIITEGVYSRREFLEGITDWLPLQVRRRLERERDDWQALFERLGRAHPRRRIDEKLQHLDDLQTSLVRGLTHRWRHCQTVWSSLRQRLARARPGQALARRQETLQHAEARLRELAGRRLETAAHRWASASARLRLLSTEHVLARGYSITTDAATGRVVRSAHDTQPGQKLKTRFHAGEVVSVVTPDNP